MRKRRRERRKKENLKKFRGIRKKKEKNLRKSKAQEEVGGKGVAEEVGVSEEVGGEGEGARKARNKK